jgi:hypothetical protein
MMVRVAWMGLTQSLTDDAVLEPIRRPVRVARVALTGRVV